MYRNYYEEKAIEMVASKSITYVVALT
jgi:hypothetical protein